MVEITQKITKELILSRFSEEQLYEHYLGDNFIIGGRIRSPLRNDKDPSFSLYYHRSGSIYWKDFTTGKYGSIWSLVSEIYGIDYYKAIRKVYSDLIIQLPVVLNPIVDTNIYKRNKESKVITVELRDWQNYDTNYWNKYDINQKLLELFNVKLAQKVNINDNTIWYNSRFNPIYQYLFSDNSFKCYRPLGDKNNKWTGNAKSNIIMGLDQLPEHCDLIIITKSLKDVMVYRNLGYFSVSPIAEGVYLNEEQLTLLKSKCNKILVSMDYDLCGIRTTKYYKKLGFDYYFISKDRNSRRLDVSDYYSLNGIKKTQELLQNLIKN